MQSARPNSRKRARPQDDEDSQPASSATQPASPVTSDLVPLFLPTSNPLLLPDSDSYAKAANEADHALAYVKQTKADNELLFAKETHLKDMHMVGRRPNEEIKRIAYIYFFRYHSISDGQMGEILNPNPIVNPSNYESHRKALSTLQNKARNQNLNYFKKAMKVLVENSGGYEAWAEATPEQRRNLITHMFNEHPLHFTQLSMHFEKQSVNIEGIWAGDTPTDLKWQKAIRSWFVEIAHAVYVYDTSKPAKNPNKKMDQANLVTVYCEMKKSQGWADLLGDVGQVPSRPSRHENGSRQIIPFAPLLDMGLID